jgi:hypothetical protein
VKHLRLAGSQESTLISLKDTSGALRLRTLTIIAITDFSKGLATSSPVIYPSPRKALLLLSRQSSTFWMPRIEVGLHSLKGTCEKGPYKCVCSMAYEFGWSQSINGVLTGLKSLAWQKRHQSFSRKDILGWAPIRHYTLLSAESTLIKFTRLKREREWERKTKFMYWNQQTWWAGGTRNKPFPLSHSFFEDAAPHRFMQSDLLGIGNLPVLDS